MVTRTTVVVGRVSAGRSRGSRTYVLLLSLMMIVAVIRGSTLIHSTVEWFDSTVRETQPIICECCVVYGTVAEREVVVVVDESGVVFLASRSDLVIQRISSLYMSVRRVVGMTRQTLTLLTYDTTDDVTQYMCNHGVFSSLILLNTH